MHVDRAAQMALIFGGALGQQMALVRSREP
jgi:hypothetical protein